MENMIHPKLFLDFCIEQNVDKDHISLIGKGGI